MPATGADTKSLIGGGRQWSCLPIGWIGNPIGKLDGLQWCLISKNAFDYVLCFTFYIGIMIGK